jgi:hypothetical protein
VARAPGIDVDQLDCDLVRAAVDQGELSRVSDWVPDPDRGVRYPGADVIVDAKREGTARLSGSCVYITGMLAGAAFALYPVVLPASTDPSNSLTIYNAAAGHHGLSVGLVWWTPGMILSVGYFVFIYRMFRGKVQLEGGGY